MSIEDITDTKCKECPLTAKCMICPRMMAWVKEMREKNETNRRKQITKTV